MNVTPFVVNVSLPVGCLHRSYGVQRGFNYLYAEFVFNVTKSCVATRGVSFPTFTGSSSLVVLYFSVIGFAKSDVGFLTLCHVMSRLIYAKYDVFFGVDTIGVATLRFGLPASCLMATLGFFGLI